MHRWSTLCFPRLEAGLGFLRGVADQVDAAGPKW